MQQDWHKHWKHLSHRVQVTHKNILDIFTHSFKISVIALTLAGALLLGSVVGLVIAWRQPVTVKVSLPHVEYQQDGAWDYRIHLKPNSLYQTPVLESDLTYFTQLIDQISAEFTYSLTSEPVPDASTFTYQITGYFGSPDLWERQFTVVTSATTNAQTFSIPVVIQFSEMITLMQTFRAETGAIMFNPRLLLVSQVIPEIEVNGNQIATPFRHELVFNIDGEVMESAGGLQKSQPDVLERTRFVTRSGVKRNRWLWSILTPISLILLGYVGYSYREAQANIPLSTQELRVAEKKLQGLLVHVESELPPREGQSVVQLGNIHDLIALSEETLRPILYSINQRTAHFVLIDERGAVRYEYSSEE